MGSSMTDDQFIIQVLNIFNVDYKLLRLLLEKFIGNKEKSYPLENSRMSWK
jgi:hypothetical protein